MLNKLKSLFIVEEETETEKKEPQKEANTKNAPIPKSTSPSVNLGSVDSKIIEKLLKAFEDNNQEGFDYLEYKNALKALDKMPMDEATKYRSAFATASTIGTTLDKLTSSAQFYIAILDKENKTFLSSFDSQVKNKISSKENELKQFENLIKSKSEQIKQLTLDIQKHQTQIQEIKLKLKESRGMMQSTQDNFKSSYVKLKSQLEEDIVKMEKYLK